jgi:hypothetical protein
MLKAKRKKESNACLFSVPKLEVKRPLGSVSVDQGIILKCSSNKQNVRR